jgi:hypothetical protein
MPNDSATLKPIASRDFPSRANRATRTRLSRSAASVRATDYTSWTSSFLPSQWVCCLSQGQRLGYVFSPHAKSSRRWLVGQLQKKGVPDKRGKSVRLVGPFLKQWLGFRERKGGERVQPDNANPGNNMNRLLVLPPYRSGPNRRTARPLLLSITMPFVVTI